MRQQSTLRDMTVMATAKAMVAQTTKDGKADVTTTMTKIMTMKQSMTAQ
jgi:hypothetical protein